MNLNFLLKQIIKKLSHLPLNFLTTFVTTIVYSAYPLLHKEKQHIINTLERVFLRLKKQLPLPPNKIASRCITHFSMVIAELIKLPSFSSHDFINSVEFIGLENLSKAVKDYKSAIIVVPHIGNWEILGGALAHRGFELHSFFLSQKYDFLTDILKFIRSSTKMTLHDRDRQLLSALKASKEGAVIGMMPDQDGGNHGVFTDFLGHWVSLPIGPANWSIKLNIPIVPIFCLRIKNSHKFVSFCYKPLYKHISQSYSKSSSNINNKIIELTIEIKNWMEQIIISYPSQYLWFYNHFKPRHHKYIANIKNSGYLFTENNPFFYKSITNLTNDN